MLMATFGKTTIGATPFALSANYKQVNAHTSPTRMTATSMALYVPTVVGGQSQNIRGVIYADSAGTPGALVAVTLERNVSPLDAGSVDLLLAIPQVIEEGTYWIGFIAGGPDDGAVSGAKDDVANARKYSADTYSDGPSDPFGAVDGTDSYEFTVYVVGTVAATTMPPQRLGRVRGG